MLVLLPCDEHKALLSFVTVRQKQIKNSLVKGSIYLVKATGLIVLWVSKAEGHGYNTTTPSDC